MPRNRLLGSLLIVLALGLTGLWVLRSEERRPGLETLAATGAANELPLDSPTGEEAPAADPEALRRAAANLPPTPPEPTAAGETSGAFAPDAVYGRVLCEELPIAEAKVLLFPDHRRIENVEEPMAETQTTADGRFRFEGLDVFSRYEVYAEAEGFLPRFRTLHPGRDEDVDVGRALAISGRTLDAATSLPIPGAEVRVEVDHWSEDGHREHLVVTSDDDGTYRMPWAQSDEMQWLGARRPGHTFESLKFQIDPDRAEGYDLRLIGPHTMRLEIFDIDSGQVLPDLEVELREGLTARTDQAGRIDLPAAFPTGRDSRGREHRIWLQLKVPGYCRSYASVGKPTEGSAELLRIPLTRGAKITGRVVDGNGAPIEGARVWVSSPKYRGSRAQQPPGLAPGMSVGHDGEEVLTDATGSFERTGIVPGSKPVKVYAQHPSYARAEEADILLATTGSSAELELVLGAGAVIQGRVTVDGEPVPTRVRWSGDSAGGSGYSNDRGQYHIRGVVAGEVRLSASLDERTWSNKESEPDTVWVEEGETLHHDLVVTSNRVPIAGLVRDELGEPVGGAQVWAWARNEEDFHFSTSGEAAEDGTFELQVEAKQGALYSVSAADGSRNRTLESVSPGTTGLEIVLPELGELRLAVLDAATREPVSGFSVYWKGSGTESFRSLRQGSRSYSPGPDGSFVAKLPVGAVELWVAARQEGYPPVHASGLRSERTASDRAATILMERGVLTVFEFEHAEEAREKFRKWLHSGRAALATEEQAAAQDTGGEYFQREVRYGQVLRVDDSGLARVRALAPGDYQLLWLPDELEVIPEVIEVPYVEEHRVHLKVRLKDEEADADESE